MITYSKTHSDIDLSEILILQKKNLPQNLTEIELKEQGFVTVSHTLQNLQKMSIHEQSLIIKEGGSIVGYILAMTKNSKFEVPILLPMFALFNEIPFKGKPVANYNYLVVGQVCINKEHRGIGLFDKGYLEYKNYFKEKYDFAITEIALVNERSIKAHKRVGFIEIHRYTDGNNIEWSVVVWDW